MLVIFHSSDGENHCDDGFAAALVMRSRYPEAVFYPGIYGQEPPWDLISEHDRTVLVDFSYKRSVLKKIAWETRDLLVLDHHKTAEEDLKDLNNEIMGLPPDASGRFIGLPDIRFDMNTSGAMMAWDYCYPYKCPPKLLLRIEDNDLFRTPRRYADSVYVQAVLRSYPQTWEVWEALMITPISKLAPCLSPGASETRRLRA